MVLSGMNARFSVVRRPSSAVGACVLATLVFAAAACASASAEPLALQRDSLQVSAGVPGFWDPRRRPERPDLSHLSGIRFLTETDFPPFDFAGTDGNPAGFYVDLARLICEDLKLGCTIQMRRFDTLLAALGENRGDGVIAPRSAAPPGGRRPVRRRHRAGVLAQRHGFRELLPVRGRSVHGEPVFRRGRRHRGQARQRHAAPGAQLGAVPAVGTGPLHRAVAAVFPDQPVLSRRRTTDDGRQVTEEPCFLCPPSSVLCSLNPMSQAETTAPSLREAAERSSAWPFEEARKILARLKRHPKDTVVLETGYGPSGLPHIGTFGEVARTTMVRHAFRVLTGDEVKTRLIAFSDDMDGLRKVPDNVPNRDMLEQPLGKPLTRIPDPFGTHASFGAHNNARLRAFLDRFGFD